MHYLLGIDHIDNLESHGPAGQFIGNLVTGWPIGSFRFGVAYPFASHLLFRMIGGLLGALTVLGFNRFSNKSNQG
jgi:hypothetical protein